MHTLEDIFSTLVSIPSPSGSEQAVGTWIKNFLTELHIFDSLFFDESGIHNGSNSGNLICQIHQEDPRPHLCLVAHMDTVEKGDVPIQAHLEEGVFTSLGDTILGADNKGAIAPLLYALQFFTKTDLPPLTLIFTTCEESGTFGSSLLDPSLMQTQDVLINVDGGGTIGELVEQAMGYLAFDITVQGKAAHSGLSPEKGINVLSVLSHALSQVTLGRITPDTSFNIGTITAGKGRNIVPDLLTLTCELRSFSETAMETHYQKIQEIFLEATGSFGAECQLTIHLKELPYTLDPESIVFQKISTLYGDLGLTPTPIKLSAISDVNPLSRYGVPTLNLIRGGKHPHTSKESITVKELTQLAEVYAALFRSSW